MSDKKKVMLIDDSHTIRRTAELFLKDRDVDVFLVENGFDALGEIYATKPDLIFIDLMMPKLGGYETCQIVKQHPDFKDIPIVVLSSRDGMFDKARAKMVGVEEYLTKPFSKESLLSTVDQFLTTS
jgi:twitching motility two-component system response regulator PilG